MSLSLNAIVTPNIEDFGLNQVCYNTRIVLKKLFQYNFFDLLIILEGFLCIKVKPHL